VDLGLDVVCSGEILIAISAVYLDQWAGNFEVVVEVLFCFKLGEAEFTEAWNWATFLKMLMQPKDIKWLA
jgi:hypothetical protein